VRDPQTLLELAKKNLKATAWFGLTERWKDSIQLLFSTFDLSPPMRASSERYNIHKQTRLIPEPSKEDINIVFQRSRIEWEFYEFATELFEQRLANLTLTPQQKKTIQSFLS
jgi:hypothetical protein